MSSNTNTNTRWFLVPVETVTVAGEQTNRPKYSDRTGITGFAGTPLDRDDVDDIGNVLTQNPGIGTWYVVKIYGTNSEINTLGSESDVQSLAANGQARARMLNRRDGDDRTAEQWDRSFQVRTG